MQQCSRNATLRSCLRSLAADCTRLDCHNRTTQRLFMVEQPLTLSPARHEPLAPPPLTTSLDLQQRLSIFHSTVALLYRLCGCNSGGRATAAAAAAPQLHPQPQLKPSTLTRWLQHAPPTLGRAPTAVAAEPAEVATLLYAVPEAVTSVNSCVRQPQPQQLQTLLI
jgi:hypothetical protein